MKKLLVACSKRSVNEKKRNSKWHDSTGQEWKPSSLTECLEVVKLMTETPNGHEDKFALVSLPRQLLLRLRTYTRRKTVYWLLGRKPNVAPLTC